jgi:uncharacterized protein (TIRG00374 family)
MPQQTSINNAALRPLLSQAAQPAPEEGQARKGWSRKRWAALVIGVALSIALPVLAFQGIDVWETLNLILASDGAYLALGGLFFVLTLGFRSWRWRFLLAAQQDVGLRSCLSATCVGLMANNVLPFRLGDLVRVGALHQLERTCAARVLGTIAVERILEIFTLVFFLGTYLAFAPAGPHQVELMTAGCLALAGGLLLILVMAVGSWRRRWVQQVFAAPAGWVSPRLGARVAALVGRFIEGVQVFSSPGQMVRVIGLSICLWGASISSYFCVGQALGIALPLPAYAVVVFTTCLGAVVPAAPGAVGTYHSFARMGLYLVGLYSSEEALAFAVLLHALEWTLTNVAGLYFLGRDRLQLTAAAEGEIHATPTVAGASAGPAHHPQPV